MRDSDKNGNSEEKEAQQTGLRVSDASVHAPRALDYHAIGRLL